MAIGVGDIKAEPVMQLLNSLYLQSMIIRCPNAPDLVYGVKAMIKANIERASKGCPAIFLRKS